MQYRIFEKGRLLDEFGELIDSGYAMRGLREYCRKDVKASFLKENDFFWVADDQFAVYVKAESGAFGTRIEVGFVDFHMPIHKSRRFWIPKRVHLTEDCNNGSYQIKAKGMNLGYEVTESEVLEDVGLVLSDGDEADVEQILQLRAGWLTQGARLDEDTLLLNPAYVSPYEAVKARANIDIEKDTQAFSVFNERREEGVPDKSKKRSVRICERRLKINVLRLDGEHNFECEILLAGHIPDYSVLITPYQDKRHFSYCQKATGLSASGSVRFGDATLSLDNNLATGTFSWLRGAFKRPKKQIWAVASEISQKGGVGFSLGTSLGGNREASENMLFIGGKGQKLEEVEFTPSQTKFTSRPYLMGQWQIGSEDSRVRLTFRPVIRSKGRSKQRIYGLYNGSVILDNGQLADIVNLLGFLELG